MESKTQQMEIRLAPHGNKQAIPNTRFQVTFFYIYSTKFTILRPNLCAGDNLDTGSN